MKKIIIGFSLVFSSQVFSYEGPFLSAGIPKVRLSSSGYLQIFRMPDSAACFGNKAEFTYVNNEGVSNMILSVALAAQMSSKKIKVWINRYDSTTPQRCGIAFIEIAE